LFQSTKCGPTSAATSARIRAIAILSSVACISAFHARL
jgi:hypothetical protein